MPPLFVGLVVMSWPPNSRPGPHFGHPSLLFSEKVPEQHLIRWLSCSGTQCSQGPGALWLGEPIPTARDWGVSPIQILETKNGKPLKENRPGQVLNQHCQTKAESGGALISQLLWGAASCPSLDSSSSDRIEQGGYSSPRPRETEASPTEDEVCGSYAPLNHHPPASHLGRPARPFRSLRPSPEANPPAFVPAGPEDAAPARLPNSPPPAPPRTGTS